MPEVLGDRGADERGRGTHVEVRSDVLSLLLIVIPVIPLFSSIFSMVSQCFSYLPMIYPNRGSVSVMSWDVLGLHLPGSNCSQYLVGTYAMP